MNFIYKIMGVDKKPDDKYKYIWFTMGTACFALATLVMTIVISRLLGETQECFQWVYQLHSGLLQLLILK